MVAPRSRFILMLVGLSVACSPRPSISGVTPQPPPDILWLGFFQLLEDGRVESSTPLRARDDDGLQVSLPQLEQEGQAFIVGYTDRTLSSIVMTPPSAEAVLRAAEGEDPTLPEPNWVASSVFSQDVLRLSVDESSPPPLTTEEVLKCAPRITAADDRCRIAACRPTVSPRTCGLNVALDCGMSDFSVDYASATTLTRPTVTEGRIDACSEVEAPPGVLHRFECQGVGVTCELDLYNEIESRASTTDAAQLFEPTATFDGLDDLKQGRRGGITDAIKTTSGIAILGHTPAFFNSCRGTSELRWLDAKIDFDDRLVFSDCATAMAPAAEDAIWVVATDSTQCPRLALYDRTGLIRERRLDCNAYGNLIPSSVATSPNGVVAVLFFDIFGRLGMGNIGRLAQFDAQTLVAVTNPVSVDGARRVTYADGHWVMIAENDLEFRVAVGASVGEVKVDLQDACTPNVSVSFIKQTEDGYFVFGPNLGSLVARVGNDGRCQTGRPFHSFDARLTSLTEGPRSFVGGLNGDSGDGFLIGLDAAESRLLPDLRSVGPGPVTELLWGGDDALWVIKGITGELLRLEDP